MYGTNTRLAGDGRTAGAYHRLKTKALPGSSGATNTYVLWVCWVWLASIARGAGSDIASDIT